MSMVNVSILTILKMMLFNTIIISVTKVIVSIIFVINYPFIYNNYVECTIFCKIDSQKNSYGFKGIKTAAINGFSNENFRKSSNLVVNSVDEECHESCCRLFSIRFIIFFSFEDMWSLSIQLLHLSMYYYNIITIWSRVNTRY